MGTPFLGEIKMMAFGFAPKGYALCNGQMCQITQNQALFALLGTTFGGDGKSTFGLPNLAGRTPLHVGNGFALGQNGGEAAHTLSTGEIPPHTHAAYGSAGAGTDVSPADDLVATYGNFYGPAQGLVPASASTIANAGAGQSHPNMQPYCAVNFCIALQGIYPPRQ